LAGKTEDLSNGPTADHVHISDRPGRTVTVIGDAFTASYFPLMLMQHVGRVIWLNHRQCGFDWKWIYRFRSDEVWRFRPSVVICT
jgi:hypothetical protein